MSKEDNSLLSNSLVFLNTPIHEKSEDIIGFQNQVDTLQTAINKGAQMVAITSPFGAGKSSITELLRVQKEDQQVINISMWSHLCKQNKGDTDGQTTDLHRSFLYQIVSNLDPRKGSYISRRLSKNYGLLKLHLESPGYYFVAFTSLVCFILGYVLPYVFNVGIPSIWGPAELWNGMLLLISAICFVYVVVQAGVVFSSKKSEGSMSIDENELKELYRKFVVSYCNSKRKKKIQKFIFVIEDLDRTDQNDCVITFLKELRKYYTLGSNQGKQKSKIVFIVNVKPETSLCQNAGEHKVLENESLYAKLFDFVLNVQTINIDDYETVLESILEQSRETIMGMFTDAKCSRLVDIQGMQWIIHGKNFGIRDIKDRLNRAFALFNSLKHRFPSSPVEFEKCAVVAYLTTAYEQDFIATNDRSFGQLVESHLQHKLDESLCKETLENCSKAYVAEVLSLVKAKLIDTNYRMYFYNYPQKSKIYSHDEHAIEKAILYGDSIEGLEEMAERVTNNNVSVVYEALDKLKKLKMHLPDVIFKCEALFMETLRHYPSGIYEWISELDYSKNAFEKTSKQIIDILSFDKSRSVYSKSHALKLCNIWEDKVKANELLQLRFKLCKAFPGEILWYKQLFMDVHNIVSFEELGLISFIDAIQITNVSKDTFDVEYIQYILQRFEEEKCTEEVLVNYVQEFLTSSEEKLGQSTTVKYLMRFMLFLHKIIPEYETSIMNQLRRKDLPFDEHNQIFVSYQQLINLVSKQNLTENTLKNIQEINEYYGYSEQVSTLLEKAGYIFESSIIRLYLNLPIEYRIQVLIDSMIENINWLLKHEDVFMKLRLSVLKTSNEKNVFEYAFLFTEECPILTDEELSTIKYLYSDEAILKLIPASIVTTDEVIMLQNFFNRRFQQNSIAYNYLEFIARMPNAVAKECFYSLNFDAAIKYCSFSAERKKNIKEMFNKILGLDTVAEKIKFMHATRFLDSSWEEIISDTVRTNTNLQKSYIEAVNKSSLNPVRSSTIRLICSFSSFYALNDIVTEGLYRLKQYKHYVICKSLFHKQFTLDQPERADAIWEIYMEIFSGSIHRGVRDLMDGNYELIKMIMERKSYTSFSNERRNILSKILQDSYCLQEAANRGENFATEYYQKIEGFADEAAVETFVSIVEDKPNLLRSQAIYDNCYEKILNSTLKAKYTRARRKSGYM